MMRFNDTASPAKERHRLDRLIEARNNYSLIIVPSLPPIDDDDVVRPVTKRAANEWDDVSDNGGTLPMDTSGFFGGCEIRWSCLIVKSELCIPDLLTLRTNFMTLSREVTPHITERRQILRIQKLNKEIRGKDQEIAEFQRQLKRLFFAFHKIHDDDVVRPVTERAANEWDDVSDNGGTLAMKTSGFYAGRGWCLNVNGHNMISDTLDILVVLHKKLVISHFEHLTHGIECIDLPRFQIMPFHSLESAKFQKLIRTVYHKRHPVSKGQKKQEHDSERAVVAGAIGNVASRTLLVSAVIAEHIVESIWSVTSGASFVVAAAMVGGSIVVNRMTLSRIVIPHITERGQSAQIQKFNKKIRGKDQEIVELKRQRGKVPWMAPEAIKYRMFTLVMVHVDKGPSPSIEEQQAALQATRIERDAARGDLATVTTERDQAKEELSTVKVERDTAKSEMVTLKAERDAAKRDVTSFQAERDAAKGDLATVTTERDQAKDELSTVKAGRDTAKGEVITLKAERDAARGDLATVTTKRDQAKDELSTVKAEQDTAKGEVITLKAERDAARREVALVQAERDTANARREEQEAASNGEMVTLTAERDAARGYLVTVRTERDAVKDELSTVKVERDTARGKVITLKDERDSPKRVVALFQAEKDAARFELNQALEQIKREKNQHIDELIRQKHNLKQKRDELIQQNDNLKQQKIFKDQEIDELKQQIAAKDQTIHELQAENQALIQKVIDLEQKDSDELLGTNHFPSDVTSTSLDIIFDRESVECERCTEYCAKIVRLQEKLMKGKEKRQVLEQENETLTRQLDGSRETANLWKYVLVEEARDLRRKDKRDLEDKYKQEVAVLNDKIHSLENDNNSLNKKVCEQKREHEMVEQNILREGNAEKKTLQSKISALEIENSSLAEKITEAAQQRAALDAVKAQLETVTDERETARTQFNHLQTYNGALLNLISQFRRRLQDLEDREKRLCAMVM